MIYCSYMHPQTRRGFTLIELLAVIAIIGVIAAAALISMSTARARGRDARRVADVRAVMTALEFYQSDLGGYPVGRPAIMVPQVELGRDQALVLTNNGFEATPTGNKTFLSQVPADPTPSQNYLYVARETNYAIGCTSGPCAQYTIQFTLERGIQNLPAGHACAHNNGSITAGGC